jgi:hypothetical protein
LSLVNAQQRGLLSQILQECRKDLCLLEDLQILDSLGKDRCDISQKGFLFTLVINDLKAAKSPLYANYLQHLGRTNPSFLEDPHVQFLAYAISAPDQFLEQQEMKYMTIPEPLRKPLSDYLMEISFFGANQSSIDWLLVQFWNQLHHDVTIQFVEQALLNYDTMVC